MNKIPESPGKSNEKKNFKIKLPSSSGQKSIFPKTIKNFFKKDNKAIITNKKDDSNKFGFVADLLKNEKIGGLKNSNKTLVSKKFANAFQQKFKTSALKDYQYKFINDLTCPIVASHIEKREDFKKKLILMQKEQIRKKHKNVRYIMNNIK